MLGGDAGQGISAVALEKCAQLRVRGDALEEGSPERMWRSCRRYSAGGFFGDAVCGIRWSAYPTLQLKGCIFRVVKPIVCIPLFDCSCVEPIGSCHPLDGCDGASAVDG